MPTNFIVDFTLDERGQLHLLELGLLEYSMFSSYEKLGDEYSVAKQFCKILKSKSEKAFYHIDFRREDGGGCNVNASDSKDTDNYSSTFNYQLPSEQDEIIYKFYLALAKLENDRNIVIDFNPYTLFIQDDVEHYDPHVLFKQKQRTTIREKAYALLKWLRNKTSSLIPLSASKAFSAACDNKAVFHRAAKDSKIYPRTFLGCFSGDSYLQSLQAFLAENPSEYYVLKPTGESLAKGIVVLSKDVVLDYLSEIKHCETKDNYWSLHYDKDFLLQTCVPSKEVKHQEKNYRPTGRLIVSRDDGVGEYSLLGAYWKLPSNSSDNKESFGNTNLVARVAGDHVIKMALTDQQLAWSQFKKHFPAIYQNIEAQHKDNIVPIPNVDEEITRVSLDDCAEAIMAFVNALVCSSPAANVHKLEFAAILAGLPREIAVKALGNSVEVLKFLFVKYWEKEIDDESLSELLRKQPQLQDVKSYVVANAVRATTAA